MARKETIHDQGGLTLEDVTNLVNRAWASGGRPEQVLQVEVSRPPARGGTGSTLKGTLTALQVELGNGRPIDSAADASVGTDESTIGTGHSRTFAVGDDGHVAPAASGDPFSPTE